MRLQAETTDGALKCDIVSSLSLQFRLYLD